MRVKAGCCRCPSGIIICPLWHYFSYADEETEARGDDGAQLGCEARFLYPKPVFSPLLSLRPSSPDPLPGAKDSSLYCVLATVLGERGWEPHHAESERPTEVPPWIVEEPMTLVSITPSPDCPRRETGRVSWLPCPQGGCPPFTFNLPGPQPRCGVWGLRKGVSSLISLSFWEKLESQKLPEASRDCIRDK